MLGWFDEIRKDGLRIDSMWNALMYVDACDLAEQLIEVRDIDHGVNLAARLLHLWSRYDPRAPYAGLINSGFRAAAVEGQLNHAAQASVVGDHDNYRVSRARIVD